ncbi:MAG TPA: hypothetical protein VK760_08525 [Candidatus Acidoferrales bacterium]|nr:hypothetical protein [Candidatus Acidoferrales bacterium]
MESIVASVDVPPVKWHAIEAMIAAPQPLERRPSRVLQFALAAAACIAIVFVAFPASSLGLVKIIVSSYQEAFKVIGWTPPSGGPKTAERPAIRADAAAAQAHLGFTLVPPSGLPADVVATKIFTAPVQIYTKATKIWSTGPTFASFSYRRANGHSFSILTAQFDQRTGSPAKYVFDAQDLPGGRTALTRHEKFTWRNGDQVTSIVSGDGISAPEILAIRQSMNGAPIEGVYPNIHDGTIVERYLIVEQAP